MTGHRVGRAIFVETADSRPQHNRSSQSGKTTNQWEAIEEKPFGNFGSVRFNTSWLLTIWPSIGQDLTRD